MSFFNGLGSICGIRIVADEQLPEGFWGFAMSDKTEKVEAQCQIVKRELYKLKEHIQAIPHAEDREMGLKMFERAYGDVDVVQTFMKSR